MQGTVGNGTFCDYELPYPVCLEPKIIYNQNQMIKITFKKLLHSSLHELYCKFNHKSIKCPVIGNQLVCRAPDLIPGHYSVKVSVYGEIWSNQLFITFSHFYITESLINILAFVIGFVLTLWMIRKRFFTHSFRFFTSRIKPKKQEKFFD